MIKEDTITSENDPNEGGERNMAISKTMSEAELTNRIFELQNSVRKELGLIQERFDEYEYIRAVQWAETLIMALKRLDGLSEKRDKLRKRGE